MEPYVTACSICGAGPFECEHVEGEVYDGQRCLHVVQNFDLAEVSLTPWPRDPRCYWVSRPRTTRQVEQELGRRLAPGEVPHCRHCASCSGCAGPTEDDLDPSHFAELADE